MGFMDYIPHRWALNKSLRKEADKLKSKLDSYQIEYERRMKECQAEIDKAQLEKDADLERIKKSLEQELQQDQEMLEALLNDLVNYAATFLQRKFLYALKDNKKAQASIVDEDIKFLKSQMDEIGTEIDILRKRKSALSAFTNVQDIIVLTNDCGYDIPFSSDDDADSLLKKINDAIDNCSDDRIMRVSLFRLRGIVYERSEYLSTIKYIEWVIQQKKDYSNQLNDKKRSLITQFKSITAEVKKIDNDIKSLNQEIEAKAKHIRFFWTKSIVYLSAEIDYAYHKKDECFSQKKYKQEMIRSVGSELHQMAQSHSDDQIKWDRLQRERRDLADDIDLLNAEIEEQKTIINTKKSERKNWNEKREHICSVLAKNKVSLITNKRIAASDEQDIIISRLVEIEQIRIDGESEAEAICQQEKEKLIAEYTAKRDAYLKNYGALSAKWKMADANVTAQQVLLAKIRKQIQTIKDNDNRFFIAKWISDPPELTAAKNNEAAQNAKLSQLVKTQKALKDQVTTLSSKISDLSENHENDLKLCRPKPLRPTSEEKHEEEILKLRQKNIREKKNGNKN